MGLRNEGQVQASKVLKEITLSYDRASQYQNAYKTLVHLKVQLLSADDALAVLINAKLFRLQKSYAILKTYP